MTNEKRLIDASPDDCIKKVKRKTNFAKIIVSGTAEKPYYEIMWFGYMDGQYHIGYGSYNLDFVFRWLAECFEVEEAPTVDVYTEEQVASIIRMSHQLHATNVALEKEIALLKSCLNCKIRRECPRHCGKVVHDCDHWEYGDSTVEAVEVVHGRWEKGEVEAGDPYDGNSVYCFDVMRCSVCGECFDVSVAYNYCPNCGAKMDGGDENG